MDSSTAATYLAPTRSPLRAAPGILARRPRNCPPRSRSADLVHVVGDTSAMICASPSPRAAVGPRHARAPPDAARTRSDGASRAARMGSAGRAAARRECAPRQAELRELKAISEPRQPRLEARASTASTAGPRGRGGTQPSPRGARPPARTYSPCCSSGSSSHASIHSTAAEAVIELDRSGQRAVLLAAGDGPLRAELERLAGPAVRRPRLPRRRGSPARRGRRVRDAVGARGHVARGARGDGSRTAGVVSDGAGNPEAVGDAGIVVPLGRRGRTRRGAATAGGDPARRSQLGRRGAPGASEETFSLDALAGRHASRVPCRARGWAYGACPSRRRRARLSGSGVR